MDMLDKIRGKFFNKKSFNVGFNNRSPLSYITSTGPGVPSMPDPGMKSFEPSDWYAAYDTSSAVKAEIEAEKNKGQAIGEAVGIVGGAIAGGIGAAKSGTAGAKGGASFGEIMKGVGKGFKEQTGKLKDSSIEDEIMPDSREKKETKENKSTTTPSTNPNINIYNQYPGYNTSTSSNRNVGCSDPAFASTFPKLCP